MKAILELSVEGTESADEIGHIVGVALDAISGSTGEVRVYPRLLIELTPNYLEIPIHWETSPRIKEA